MATGYSSSYTGGVFYPSSSSTSPATSGTTGSSAATSSIFGSNFMGWGKPALLSQSPAKSNTDLDKFITVLTESKVLVNEVKMKWDCSLRVFILKLKLIMSDTVVCEIDKKAINTNILKLLEIDYDKNNYPETSTTVKLKLIVDSPQLLDGDKILNFIFSVFPKIGEERIIDKIDSI